MSKFGKERRSPWTWNWFLQLANCIECLPWARLRALHCGHHCTVPGVQGSGAGAGGGSCLLQQPSTFFCLPVISVLITLSLSRHVSGARWCEKASLRKMRLPPSPTSLRESLNTFPSPLAVAVPDALIIAFLPICSLPTSHLFPPPTLISQQYSTPGAMGHGRKVRALQEVSCMAV